MSTSKRLIPLLNRIVVEKLVQSNKTVGGIMLPESALSKVRRRPRPCFNLLLCNSTACFATRCNQAGRYLQCAGAASEMSCGLCVWLQIATAMPCCNSKCQPECAALHQPTPTEPSCLCVQIQEGRVIAAGPGLKTKDGNTIPVSLKEGDMVLLPNYGGTEVKMGDKELVVYNEEDILAKME